MELRVYFLQVFLHLLISLLQPTKALSIVRDDTFHHFTHTPVGISFDLEQCFLGDSVYLCGVLLGLPGYGQVLVQENDHEGNHYVAHALHVPALGVAHVPDEQDSFQSCLHRFIFADLIVFAPDPPYVSLDGFMNLFLLLIEFLHTPVVLDKFPVLISFSGQYILCVVQKAIFEQIFPNLGTNAIWNSMPG